VEFGEVGAEGGCAGGGRGPWTRLRSKVNLMLRKLCKVASSRVELITTLSVPTKNN
jgi:hypothetical protein